MENNPIVLIFSFVVILVPAIFIHELGHFIMAKLVGITVLEFGIGFPPRARVLFKRGGTEYTLNWLPLGGFVRPLGEDLVSPLTDEETEAERERLARDSEGNEVETSRGVAVSDVSPPRRILFMAGGPLFNVLFAALLFAAAAIVGRPDIDHSDIVIASLGWDSPLLQVGVRPGDVIRAINGQPLDTAKNLYDYLASHPDTPVTLTVERDGQQHDFGSLGLAVIASKFVSPGPHIQAAVSISSLCTASNLCAPHGFPSALYFTLPATAGWSAQFVDAGDATIISVNADSPAETAGLKADDIILAGRAETRYPVPSLGIAQVGDPESPTVRSLDNYRVHTATGLSRLIRSSVGWPITMTIARDGAPHQLTVLTRTNPPEGQGATGITLFTDYPVKIVREPLSQALVSGIEDALTVTGRLIEAPILIIRGQISFEQARPIGIVGISQVGGEFLRESVEVRTPAPALEYAALISIALGITNLLPLPALDGGRILFTLVEMVRGKRMDPAREGMIHLIGLMVLMALMVLIIIADIAYPFQLR